MATVILNAPNLDDFVEELEVRGIEVRPAELKGDYLFTGTRSALENMIETFWGYEIDSPHTIFDRIKD